MFMNKEKGKQVFKKWAKKNMLNLQKEGEEENPEMVKRAQGMFENRRNAMKYRSMSIRKGGDGEDRFKGRGPKRFKNQNQAGPRREVKNAAEIMKVKSL
jgi:hypothetical protein